MKLISTWLLGILSLWSIVLLAQTQVAHTQPAQSVLQQLDAHVHGLAKLTLLQDRHTLLIELESPAVNIVGFEHEPQNDDQVEQIARALTLLQQPDSVMRLSSLGCELIHALSNTSGKFDSQPHAAHQNTDDHKHSHSHNENHAEFRVIFELRCSSQTPPSELVVTAFDNFSGIETLEVQWVLNGSQGAQRLTATQTRLRFRQ